MRYVNILSIALAMFVLTTTFGKAEEVPSIPEIAVLAMSGLCNVYESNPVGFCKYYIQPDKTFWLKFYQNDEVVFIRYIEVGQLYMTVWTKHGWNSF